MLKITTIIIITSFFLSNVSAQLVKRSANDFAIGNDVKEILKEAKYEENFIRVNRLNFKSDKNQFFFKCNPDESSLIIEIIASDEHWGQSAYYALNQLGFLFPSPRTQITPKKEDILKKCDQSGIFNPSFNLQGVHFDTLYANEWHISFYQDQKMAIENIKWLARNYQNLIGIKLFNYDIDQITHSLDIPFRLARNFGMHTAIDVSFDGKDKAFKLLDFFSQFSTTWAESGIKKSLNTFVEKLPLSYILFSIDNNPNKSLVKLEEWKELIANLLNKYHVEAIFYLRSNHLANEISKGRYIIKNSILNNYDYDVPILNLSQLSSISSLKENLHHNGVKFVLHQSKALQMGSWLNDWTQMLTNSKDYEFSKLIGIEKIEDDHEFWKDLFLFYEKYLKEKELINIITFENHQAEFLKKRKTTNAIGLQSMRNQKDLMIDWIQKLEEMMSRYPNLESITNQELALLLKVLFYKISHSRNILMAHLYRLESVVSYHALKQAGSDRKNAKNLLIKWNKQFNQYPELKLNELNNIPTIYPLNYIYLSTSLYYWQRVERQVKEDHFSAFYKNPIPLLDIFK